MTELIAAQRELALRIMTTAHAGQTREFGEDKGKPYSVHPLRVEAELMKLYPDNWMLGCTALLHDVIEDGGWTREMLVAEGVDPAVAETVLLLTRDKGETYFDFILRIADSDNWNAKLVKIADLKDNANGCPEGSRKDKYRFASRYIRDSL